MPKDLTAAQDSALEAMHGRLTREIVSRIVKAPLEIGGSPADIFLLCESILVGVVTECFEPAEGNKALRLIMDLAKDDLSRQLADMEALGHG